MGILSVVGDVGTEMDDEREPTWDEAIAALATAAPVEVVRPPRRITVDHSTDISAAVSANVILPLQPGQSYTWSIEVDGKDLAGSCAIRARQARRPSWPRYGTT